MFQTFNSYGRLYHSWGWLHYIDLKVTSAFVHPHHSNSGLADNFCLSETVGYVGRQVKFCTGRARLYPHFPSLPCLELFWIVVAFEKCSVRCFAINIGLFSLLLTNVSFVSFYAAAPSSTWGWGVPVRGQMVPASCPQHCTRTNERHNGSSHWIKHSARWDLL